MTAVEITVNDLTEILSKHFKKSVMIEAVTVANINYQYKPRCYTVGLGGICTLRLEVN